MSAVVIAALSSRIAANVAKLPTLPHRHAACALLLKAPGIVIGYLSAPSMPVLIMIKPGIGPRQNIAHTERSTAGGYKCPPNAHYYPSAPRQRRNSAHFGGIH
jgi:hypothetical protein